MSNPCVTRDSYSLMISESIGAVSAAICASLVTAVYRLFLSPYGLFGLSNPCVIHDSTSLMISQSLGGVWAVESLR